ncbi:MAG: glycosyltransferase [Candidatus Azambacteria bacterium]|nr:glycosyltransferase [Candidatus Azambacteria bacterium]
MKRIGIECEQLEGKRFGVGHTLAQLLDAATKVPDIEKNYRFVLYFKAEIPTDAFLSHPLFEKKILTGGIIPRSFNVFYHILIPIYSLVDHIDCFFFPSYMLPAFFVGKSVVVLTNDVYWEAHHGSLPLKYRLAYRIFCWWAAKRAQRIMTISQFAGDELRGFYGIPEKRLVINPWGLEECVAVLEKNDAYARTLTDIKKRLGITEKFFISVGQAFPRRHMKEAVEAFGTIADKYPNIQYCVACFDKYDPPVLEKLYADINARAGRNAIIQTSYIGRNELIYLMNDTLGMVYVSDKEALGLPPLETLACGRPSVIADTPLAHELFGDDGFFVKNTSDPASIAEQLIRIIEHRYDAERIVALQRPHLARLSWSVHTTRLLVMFDDVIKKR